MTQDASTFVYATYIRTTPEKLWQALTSPEFSEKYWFGFRLEGDWRPGGTLNFRTPKKLNLDLPDKVKNCIHDSVCQVLICEPPKHLSYTFPSNDTPEIAAKRKSPSRVTYELTPMGEMVKLRLVHENLLPEDVEKDTTQWRGINNGWPGVLSNLKTLLETGKEMAFSGKAG